MNQADKIRFLMLLLSDSKVWMVPTDHGPIQILSQSYTSLAENSVECGTNAPNKR